MERMPAVSVKDSPPAVKYSENVVLVAPPPVKTSSLPKSLRGKVRKAKISEAIEFVFDEALAGKSTEFSVVVHRGTYVDDLTRVVPKKGVPAGVSIEIIGSGPVEIVCRRKTILVQNVTLSLRDLVIFDGAKKTKLEVLPMIRVEKEAKVDFVDAKITCASDFALGAQGKGSRIALTGCHFSGCYGGFILGTEAQIHMKETRFTDTADDCGHCFDGSALTAVKTHFDNCVWLHCLSRGCFVDSKFVAGPGFQDRASGSIALSVGAGSFASVKSCSFTDFGAAAAFEKTGSIGIFHKCVVTSASGTAFYLELNADLHVFDSVLQCDRILEMFHNVNGSVRFKRNTSLRHPVVMKDRQSVLPDTDFDLIYFVQSDSVVVSDPGKMSEADYRKKVGAGVVGDVDPRKDVSYRHCS